MVEAARGRRKPLHHSHDLGVAQAIKVGFWPILLKKSEYRLGPIFSAPWARFSDADAGDLVIRLELNGASSKSICGGS